jgi:hypothetical protein
MSGHEEVTFTFLAGTLVLGAVLMAAYIEP